MKQYAYYHWDGKAFQFRGTVTAADDLSAFDKACRTLHLFHRGNIAVQPMTTAIH